MPRYIVKLNDKKGNSYYLEWSTVVDAPVCSGVDLEGFKAYYKEEYGIQGMYGLEGRLERVEQKGTSCVMDESAEDTISLNVAGPGGARLSYDEIVRKYCLGEQFDENHPCWEQRSQAIDELYEKDGGLTHEDLEEVFKRFPYPEN